MKKINFKFDINIKKVFFATSFIFFIYLLYLSIPSLYDTGRVQKDIVKKLNQDFNLNFSLSTDIHYRILPKPHFIIKDCELIELQSNVSKRIAEIQELKIFINQTNFFNKDITIKNLSFSKANFFISKSNIEFIKKFLDNKFSKKAIKVNKSKIFFRDKRDEIVFIYTIKKIGALYDDDENKNKFFMEGDLFNINNKINWTKNFITNKKVTKVNAKKILLNILNEANLINKEYEYNNTLEFQSSKFKTNYKLSDNNISFSSKKSLIKNTIIDYQGNVDLNPFNLSIDINSKKLDLNYIFKNLNLINEILLSKILFKRNLYGEIKILSNDIPKAKIFDNSKININFQGGEINLNNTTFFSKNLGTLKLKSSKFLVNEENLLFQANSKLNVKDLNYFYKVLLTPKKNRIKFNSIDFLFQINLQTGSFKIKKIILYDEKNKILNKKISENFLTDYIDNEFSYFNPIKFKNFLNELFIVYLDG